MASSITKYRTAESAMTVAGQRIEIVFDGVSPVEAGTFVNELQRYLLDEEPDLDVIRVRVDSEAQDTGTVLAVVLSSPVIIAVARGIQAWFEHRSSSKVVFKQGSTWLKVDRINAGDAAVLAEKLTAAFLESRDQA
jgi:hypothetical protein